MYNRPQLVRYGSFRDLTLYGGNSGVDLAIIVGIVSCNASSQNPITGCWGGSGGGTGGSVARS